MLISVIIPVFNAAYYLERCLDSIVNQSHRELEVILIDDCSTDNSLDVLLNYQKKDSRIKVIRNNENMLAGVSRNKGLQQAIGDYIWFVDADDWIAMDSIERLVSVLNESTETTDVILFGHAKHGVSEKGNFKERIVPHTSGVLENPFENFLKLTNGAYSYIGIYLFSRAFILKYQIVFPENVYFEDILFFSKAMFYANQVLTLSDPLYNYNIEEHSSITQQASIKKIKDILFIYQELNDLLIEEEVFDKYNDPFVIRFLVFGLARIFQIYFILSEKEQDEKELKFGYSGAS